MENGPCSSYSRELIRLCSFLWANNPENKCWKDWAWVYACTQSCPTLFVALWAEVHCVPLSMRFPRQKYWNQLSFPPPGDIPSPGIVSVSVTLSGRFLTLSSLRCLSQTVPVPIPNPLLGRSKWAMKGALIWAFSYGNMIRLKAHITVNLLVIPFKWRKTR